ncbi:hypothetical protein NARC_10237 [Candidatus Nitrosocosmicus arcticus]|uniref:Uncharacterized protein n=1 Tax=Candidatus Nitrosocosmicus arcticus TaxID=2035267 RepID=A0A557SYZ5_9ARCH|nr:hypothetical protein NARC_10237 [Candidatus Nitrosocosmicus arcticus]
MPSNYDIDLKRVCLFHKKDFNKLSRSKTKVGKSSSDCYKNMKLFR